jgi:hypothetical protein
MSKRTDRVLKNSKPPAPFSIWSWSLENWWVAALAVVVALVILGLLAAKAARSWI